MDDLEIKLTAQASLLAKARVAFEEIAADECYVGSGDEGEMMGEEHCGHCIAKEALALLDSSDPKAAEIERLKEAVIYAADNLEIETEVTQNSGIISGVICRTPKLKAALEALAKALEKP